MGYLAAVTEEDLVENSDYLYDQKIGKAGIENFYQEELMGQHGKKRAEVDSLGEEIKIINEDPAKSGHNLILTIDQELQSYLVDTLQAAKDASGATGAAAIALNPNTGEILAFISLPSYDNNKFAQKISSEDYQDLLDNPENPLFNRAISGEYPPGSTIKPVIAAAALQEGVINSRYTVNSVGGLRIDKWFFPDWKAGGHGVTDVKKALAESVNTFFYLVGGGNNDDFFGLGVDRINQYAQMFGLQNKTGIDLAGEAEGFLPTKQWKEQVKQEPWYIGDTYHLAIGQGDILVTPLQVANYTAFFANGGTLYQPYLLKQVKSVQGELIQETQVEIINQGFIQSGYIDLIRQGLRQTVTSGSAKSLNALPISVAGKTGTAQFATDQPTHAWFTCFAPYDQPEIVLTILLEAGGEGSDYPVGVARQILPWYFSR